MATNTTNVLLTGASSGIGLATAQLFAARGFSVWGTARELKRLPALPNFHPLVMDLSDPRSIRDGFALALQQAGHLDVLINNAGAGWFGPVEAQSDEIVHEQFQLLVHGPLELIRLALPEMRRRQKGRIINVTSLAARFPLPYLGTYSAAKAAMVSFSAALRLELTGTPIRIIDLQPGNIKTNFQTSARILKTNYGPADQNRMDAVLNLVNRQMEAAPSPQLVARAILKIINSANPPPVVTVGDFFQARFAPILGRIFPTRLIEWYLRKYYGL